MVLAKSLERSITNIPLCVLVFADAISTKSRHDLGKTFDQVIDIDKIQGIGAENLKTIGRPDLKDTLAKLHLWAQTQYEKILFLDADTLVLSNLDHLFDIELTSSFELAASPEVGFSDCFNSGLMLLRPSATTFSDLMHLASTVASFDGGDQGLLNIYFGDGTRNHPCKNIPSGKENISQRNWHRLSVTYNLALHSVYRLYISAALRYSDEHKVLHFIGKQKPWHFDEGFVPLADDMSPYEQFYAKMVSKWWDTRHSL